MSEKPHKCLICERRFLTLEAAGQHERDAHRKNQKPRRKYKHSHRPLAHRPDVGIAGAKSVLESVGEDLSDGAFWALADELGLSPEDYVDD